MQILAGFAGLLLASLSPICVGMNWLFGEPAYSQQETWEHSRIFHNEIA